MKKSLLALAILAPIYSANAATVYDTNGTTLSVGGRVQSVFFSPNSNKAGEKDASLVNSARLNIGGQTKINDYVSALAFTEWDVADGHKRNVNDNIKSREQYVGASFNKFGQVIAGKTFDATRVLQLATDTFETLDVHNDSGLNGDRRNGVVRYDFNAYNAFASVSYQIAADDQTVFGKKRDLESGYGLTVGYTFDNVLTAPLAIKAGFNHLEGQDDETAQNTYNEDTGSAKYARLDKANNYGLSVAWGSLADGPYLAAYVYKQKSEFEPINVVPAGNTVNSFEHERTGYEFLGGYYFENGIAVYAGYQVQKQKANAQGIDEASFTYKRIPVQVKYTYQGVKLWAEVEFDAGSDKKEKYADVSPLFSGEFTPYSNHTQFTVGARYTF